MKLMNQKELAERWCVAEHFGTLLAIHRGRTTLLEAGVTGALPRLSDVEAFEAAGLITPQSPSRTSNISVLPPQSPLAKKTATKRFEVFANALQQPASALKYLLRKLTPFTSNTSATTGCWPFRYQVNRGTNMRDTKPNSTTAGTPTVLTETELSQRWKMSIRTLQFWRYRRTGPGYIKITVGPFVTPWMRSWLMKLELESSLWTP